MYMYDDDNVIVWSIVANHMWSTNWDQYYQVWSTFSWSVHVLYVVLYKVIVRVSHPVTL